MIAAIFDLDGTLFGGSILQGIIRHHRAHRVNRLRLYFYMGSHIAIWPLFRLGLLSATTARVAWARHMGWPLGGMTPDQAGRAFAWIAEEYVEPLLFPDVVARLREHQAAGHRVIIVSGTPSPLLAEIGRRLGVDETVGTPLVLRNGRYSGASELPTCQGADKVTRLEMYLSDDHGIDWAKSYAYADSHTDIPLLEFVGNPVAVYPDPQLAAHAAKLDWEIMEPMEIANE